MQFDAFTTRKLAARWGACMGVGIVENTYSVLPEIVKGVRHVSSKT